jgi:hypothetical protein
MVCFIFFHVVLFSCFKKKYPYDIQRITYSQNAVPRLEITCTANEDEGDVALTNNNVKRNARDGDNGHVSILLPLPKEGEKERIKIFRGQLKKK